MSDLKSNIAKGLIAAVCSALAMIAGAASLREEAQAQGARAPDPPAASASRVL